MLGTTLRGHYKIIRQMGSGGFGETFLAEITTLPDNPLCVVKRLKFKPNPKVLQIVRRLFDMEAKVLYKLGNHEQIPRLIAHFEENQEFYLVQQFIDGNDLSQELTPGKRWSESQVITFLKELLGILAFVHQQQVIHRDIKPPNLIRRRQDRKLVLIDFGAIKEIMTFVVNAQGQTSFTMPVDTPGYRPNEQQKGTPRFSHDIYAVGMIAIQALTGVSPQDLEKEPQTGEVKWRMQASVSDKLAAILDKMVRTHFRDRYQSVDEVFNDLRNLKSPAASIVGLLNSFVQPYVKPWFIWGTLVITAIGGASFVASKFLPLTPTASQLTSTLSVAHSSPTTTNSPTSPADITSPNSNSVSRILYSYTSSDGKYTAKFPGKPNEQSRATDSLQGKITGAEVRYVDNTKQQIYVTGHVNLPKLPDANIQQILNNGRDNMVKSSGATLKNEKQVSQNGLLGKEFIMSLQDGTAVKARIYINPSNKRIYQAIFVSKDGNVDSPETNAFLDSLSIEK